MKDFQFWKRIQKNSSDTIHILGIFIIPILLCITAIMFWGVSQILSWQTQNLQIQPNPYPKFQAAEYPVVEHDYIPEISAEAAYVMDVNSHVPIYSKNSDIRFSPASTTKIMTFLTAIDYFKLNDVLTVKRDSVEGSGLRLRKGEQLTFQNLLYAMMLPSANDAAYSIADNYPGGMKAFVEKMNKKAQELHLTNAHYQDSAGLTDDGDFITAHDEAVLASVALENPLFAKVVDTKKYTVTSLEGDTYPVENLNELLGLYGVIGVKTGYTEEAGEVLVTATKGNGHIFVIVVMRSADRFGDTEKLLQLINNNVTFLSIH